MSKTTIIIIPARGGSKGVPRKNLRPLAGKPLIFYSIDAALGAKSISRVVVSTDDEEIALFAKRFGAEVIKRPSELGDDAVTLDPVIVHAVSEAEKRWKECYDFVLTVQPTSPLVESNDLDKVVALLDERNCDTVLTAVDDRHLRWTKKDTSYIPMYKARINRQQMEPCFRETGAVIGCRRNQLRSGSRIGSRTELYITPLQRSVDIDAPEDFSLCERLINRRTIAFVVTGHKAVGMGHVYRALMLAHELVEHHVLFVCCEEDDLAISYIQEKNFPVEVCTRSKLDEFLVDKDPDLVINDILDTSSDYVRRLQDAGIAVVNFEDMGDGANYADLTINALYPHQKPRKNFLIGSDYFCLRDEFVHPPERRPISRVERILISFGGVDEKNLTARTLHVLGPILQSYPIQVDVVVGPGYAHGSRLHQQVSNLNLGGRVTVTAKTSKISEHMAAADLAITSGGRTVYELASLGVPSIVICQNKREMAHTFASEDNGVINLGLASNLEDKVLLKTVSDIMDETDQRLSMRRKMLAHNFTDNKRRVIQRILELLR